MPKPSKGNTAIVIQLWEPHLSTNELVNDQLPEFLVRSQDGQCTR